MSGGLRKNSEGTRTVKVTWDEENLLTNELERPSSMSIADPKTPYNFAYSASDEDSDGSDVGIDQFTLEQREVTRRFENINEMYSDSSDGWESGDDIETTIANFQNANQIERDEFLRKRRDHYKGEYINTQEKGKSNENEAIDEG